MKVLLRQVSPHAPGNMTYVRVNPRHSLYRAQHIRRMRFLASERIFVRELKDYSTWYDEETASVQSPSGSGQVGRHFGVRTFGSVIRTLFCLGG